MYIFISYFSSCQRCHYLKNVDVTAFVLSSWFRQGNNNATLQGRFYQVFASMTLSCFALYSNYILGAPTLQVLGFFLLLFFSVAVVCHFSATISSHLSASQCTNVSVCMTSVGHSLHHTLVIWLCSKLDSGLNCSLSSLLNPFAVPACKISGLNSASIRLQIFCGPLTILLSILCISMKTLSPDMTLCGWLGSNHQLTN